MKGANRSGEETEHSIEINHRQDSTGRSRSNAQNTYGKADQSQNTERIKIEISVKMENEGVQILTIIAIN